jgi:hypothetical protein
MAWGSSWLFVWKERLTPITYEIVMSHVLDTGCRRIIPGMCFKLNFGFLVKGSVSTKRHGENIPHFGTLLQSVVDFVPHPALFIGTMSDMAPKTDQEVTHIVFSGFRHYWPIPKTERNVCLQLFHMRKFRFSAPKASPDRFLTTSSKQIMQYATAATRPYLHYRLCLRENEECIE